MNANLLCVGIVLIPLTAVISQAKVAYGGELIINGSFESPVVGGIDQMFSAPSTAITGWLVTERSVDINRTSSIFGTAHTGDQMLDINGLDNGTIQQTFQTTIGDTYVLSLYYANNPNPSFSQPSYFADVTVSGSETLFYEFLEHAGSTAHDMKWQNLTCMFIADSDSAILQLRSRMLGFNGVVFDSVSVLRIPEPNGIVLGGICCAVAACWSATHRRSLVDAIHRV